MARCPGLVRRKARWYLRSRIPADLTDFLKRAEIWRSLGTVEFREAVRRYTLKRAELQGWLDQQRRRRDAGERLNGEAAKLVAGWFHGEERKAATADFALVGDDLTAALGETDQTLFELLSGGDGESVQAAIDRMLIANGWPSRPHTVGSIQTKKVRVADAPAEHRAALAETVRRALIEAARRRLDRLTGKPNGGYDPLFSGSIAVRPGALPGEGEGLTVVELLGKFETEKVMRIGFSKRVEYNLLFQALRELWGEHRPVRSIARADCRAVRDLFASLPPNATKRFPNLTLVKAAAYAREKGLAPLNPRTANGYMARLSTLMKWAAKEEFIDRSPAGELTVGTPEVDPRDARLPFSIEQLRKIFTAPPYVPRDDRGATFWAPLVSLYGGLRLSEITQLRVADVIEQDGVHVLLVRPDPEAGTRLKTRAARRTVPVHPELTRIGLVAHAEKMRKAGEVFLFPELGRDRRGYRTNAIQKALGRQIQKAGAAAPRTSFHSFRHNFRDALREGDVSRDAVLALGGWKAGGTEEIYGGGLRPVTLAREIAKVTYPGMPQVASLDDKERDLTPEEITAFIAGHEWRVAQSMPQMPHAYVVKEKCRDAREFERFVMHIRRHGYRQKFGRAYYTYLDWPVDGVVHQFWTMGSPLDRTIIINRAVKQ